MNRARDEVTYGFSSSVVSYPDRGPDGDARYRGNTTGRIVRDFLATYHRDRGATFVDPMEGGGTSADAAAALSIPYVGLDLREGFDAQRDDLLTKLGGEPAGSIWVHPPYATMIAYSGNMWGDPHASDLSRVVDVNDFHEALQSVLQNVHRALAPGACYGVLLGLMRNNGVLHDLPSALVGYAPGLHIDALIKVQHNTTSAAKEYSGRVIRLEHEVFHVFRREPDASIVAVTIDLLGRVNRLYSATWRNLVVGFAREWEGSFTLVDLYAAFDAHPRSRANPNYRAKLRQVVSDEETIARYSRGRYAYVR